MKNVHQIAIELRHVALDFNEKAVYLFDLSDDAFDAVRKSGVYKHIESSTDISDTLRRFYLLMVAEWLEQ